MRGGGGLSVQLPVGCAQANLLFAPHDWWAAGRRDTTHRTLGTRSREIRAGARKPWRSAAAPAERASRRLDARCSLDDHALEWARRATRSPPPAQGWAPGALAERRLEPIAPRLVGRRLDPARAVTAQRSRGAQRRRAARPPPANRCSTDAASPRSDEETTEIGGSQPARVPAARIGRAGNPSAC